VKYNILFGGKAGQGPNILTKVFADALNERGFYVFHSRDYQSLIRGGHNFNVLTFSDKPVNSNESKYDLIVALDENTLEIHKKNLKKSGQIFFEKEAKQNMFFAGKVFKAFGLEFKELDKQIKNLGRYEQNLSSVKQGFESCKCYFKIKKVKKRKIDLVNGSEGISEGSIRSGLDVYYAYPMTPATPVLVELAQKQEKENILVLELENEIAVANAGVGSSITGTKTMVGTSGGGFDLMTEALSMAGIAEAPLVFYLAQRAGPSSGVATYQSQADLDIALYSGHGEFPRIVLAPGDPIETKEMVNQVFYLSQKFGMPSIVLSDKHLAESYYSSEKKEKLMKVPRETEFGRYNSYEKDPKTGSATENAEIIKKNVEARWKKFEKLKKFVSKFSQYEFYGKKNSKNCIIFWGSTKGAVVDAISDLDVCALQIKYLSPFPVSRIKKILKEKKKILCIENNATGQLCKLIKTETGIDISGKILRYDARPFLSDELREEIKKRFALK
jgi:2-oxoglutarate/2-oxoacid ferredoxin oxidoreductase subunit alpha